MSDRKKQQPGESYRNYMIRIIASYMADQMGMEAPDPVIGDGGPETREETESMDKHARDLHMELCRKSGMTADQIIADWNQKSPEDPW